MFDHMNLWNNGVMGPLVNHCLIGWNRSSLRSVSVSGTSQADHPAPNTQCCVVRYSRASESVFLPTIELVVASERHSFLKVSITVCRPSHHVALTRQSDFGIDLASAHLDLQGHSDRKVLRYVIL
jgi:hypothetical protein